MPDEKQILTKLVSSFVTFKAVGVGQILTPKKQATGAQSEQTVQTTQTSTSKPATPK